MADIDKHAAEAYTSNEKDVPIYTTSDDESTITVSVYGYATFLPGWCDVGTFFSYYTMVFVRPILYVGWKVVKKTKVVRPEEADLVWERPVIDAYEASTVEKHLGFWEECKIMMRFGKKEEEVGVGM